MRNWIAFWPQERVNLGQYGSAESAFRAITNGEPYLVGGRPYSEMTLVRKGVYRVYFSNHANGTGDHALIMTRKNFERDYAEYADVLEKELGRWERGGRTYNLLQREIS